MKIGKTETKIINYINKQEIPGATELMIRQGINSSYNLTSTLKKMVKKHLLTTGTYYQDAQRIFIYMLRKKAMKYINK